MVIELRSDTFTTPTLGMLKAMQQAPVGDDVYGEDPSCNALEDEVAGLLGKEAALFVPTGTMANQIALHLHCRPGDGVLAEEDSHCYLYEAGAAAALSGVQFTFLAADQWLDAGAWREKVMPAGLHNASTRLLVVENTHNRAGGRVTPVDQLEAIWQSGRGYDLKLHCDGARLWNGAQRLGVAEKQLARGFDSVAVCFSKGLGAPVGSALCGSREFIGAARKIRKRWGGGMRQAGYLAAAALYAIRHHRARLAEDHHHAELFAKALMECGVTVRRPEPATNMVYFRKEGLTSQDAVAQLKALGLNVGAVSATTCRAVFHLGISRQQTEAACSLVKKELGV